MNDQQGEFVFYIARMSRGLSNCNLWTNHNVTKQQWQISAIGRGTIRTSRCPSWSIDHFKHFATIDGKSQNISRPRLTHVFDI